MSSILVKELGRHIDDPGPPEYYSRPGASAWRRGFTARCWRGPDASNSYTSRFSQQAWLAGFDAAGTAIRQAQEAK